MVSILKRFALLWPLCLLFWQGSSLVAKSGDDLLLDEVPWQDGETLIFSIKDDSNEDEKGYAVLSVKSVEKQSREFWRIRFQVLSDPSALSIVDVDKEKFVPVYSLYQNNHLGEIEANYQRDGVKVERRLKKYRRSYQKSSETYDVIQSVYLMRMFPLLEDYQKRVYVVNSTQPTKQIPTILGLDVFETIETIHGLKRCFRVDADFNNQKFSFWISADDERIVYKVKHRPGIVLDLLSVSSSTDREQVVYQSNLHRFEFEIDDDWFAFKKSVVPGMESREQVLFMLPSPDCDFSLIRHPLFGEIDDVVEGSISWLKKNRKKFQLTESSLQGFELDGFSGKRFEGTYREGDVEHRVYHAILGDEKGLYLFTGNGPNEDMKALIEGMDSVVASMRHREDSP